jgi:hypothetical protein
MELRNSAGEAIGRQTVGMRYGFGTNVRDGKFTISTEEDTFKKALTFENVNANRITGNLSIVVAGIDGTDTQAAAQSKHITVATEEELYRTGYFRRAGDTGPAGGTVVAVSKDSRHGFEAAPADTEFRAVWNDANAKYQTLVINGYTGWRLPTRDELKAMGGSWGKLGMKLSGVGIYDYWTSELKNPNHGPGQYLVAYAGWSRGGYAGIDERNAGAKCYTRAVRSF